MAGADARGSKVAVIAIVKNEVKYIVEWVAHYRRLGASEIIIFDNESSDGTLDLLTKLAQKGFIRKGVVRDADCSDIAPQVEAYRQGVVLSQSEWMLFCDIDEFLYLENNIKLDEYVSRIESDVGVVVLNWRAFGSGGQMDYIDAPVTERFTKGAFSQSEANKWVKSLARRSMFGRPAIHITYSKGRYVNADGTQFVSALRPDGKEEKSKSARVVHTPAAMAHFGTKSRTEFAEKIARGNAGVKPSSQRRRTPIGDADIKWRTYNVNDEDIDYFTGTVKELRKEMALINKAIGAARADEQDAAQGFGHRLKRMFGMG